MIVTRTAGVDEYVPDGNEASPGAPGDVYDLKPKLDWLLANPDSREELPLAPPANIGSAAALWGSSILPCPPRRNELDVRTPPKRRASPPSNGETSCSRPMLSANKSFACFLRRRTDSHDERQHMSSKSVLITGAAGFIGSHLAARCLKLGWRVIALDAFTDYYPEHLKRRNIAEFASHPACKLIEGDLLDADLGPVLDAVTTVFHLAAQPGVRASWDQFHHYTSLNVNATQRLLHAASTASLERFVLASTSSIYGDAETLPTPETLAARPASPYGVTKLAAEHLARLYWRNFGVPTVCLRYFTVYGPRQRPDMAFHRLIARSLSGEPFEVFGDGNQTRDFTFVDDAVTGTIAAAEHGVPGSAYNIGGGSRRSLASVIETLGNLLGEHVELTYRQPSLGDARDTSADIRRAQHDLGFAPSFDFAAGLRKQLDWQYDLTASPEPLL